MISKKLAEQLNKIGLEWNPKKGDWYFYPDGQYVGEFLCDTDLTYLHSSTRHIWLPSLTQLLDEIPEWLNYRLERFCITIYNKDYTHILFRTSFDTPNSIEDTVAKALLEIKEREEEC
jgi:hypothetical protein